MHEKEWADANEANEGAGELGLPFDHFACGNACSPCEGPSPGLSHIVLSRHFPKRKIGSRKSEKEAEYEVSYDAHRRDAV